MTPARLRPPLTVATIGPPQQGKTTLAAALSRLLGPRSDARVVDYIELTRGGKYYREGKVETQAARWLEYTTETWRIAHLDLAGRTTRAITQIAPLTWAEAIILVISPASGASAADGRVGELLRIAAHHDTTRAIVFINQCDRDDDPELVDLAELEARVLLDACGLDGDEAPVIRGAALPALTGDDRWKRSIFELAEAIDRCLVAPPRDPTAPLRMSVLRGFSIAGQGAVAAARIERGTLRIGDKFDLLGTTHHRWLAPEDRLLRTRRVAASLHAFDRVVDVGRPGELLGVTVPARADEGWRMWRRVCRGLTIAAPDSLALRRRFTACVRLLAADEGGWPRELAEVFTSQVVIGTASEGATLRTSTPTPRAGDTVLFEVSLVYPMAILGGERLLVRRHDRLIGLGVVVEPLGPIEVIEIDGAEP
ncbi:GTP-binding protein [Nannocystis pusilla]|uniref:GTP-binding protein n=1 Tax=Nannocystis pusilla TaxID=889268 RepID=A0A9X3IYH3_9BACT|nr:GTP-binding protein [Nannocystis pusilla]